MPLASREASLGQLTADREMYRLEDTAIHGHIHVLFVAIGLLSVTYLRSDKVYNYVVLTFSSKPPDSVAAIASNQLYCGGGGASRDDLRTRWLCSKSRGITLWPGIVKVVDQ